MVQLVALSSIPRVDLNKLMLTTDTNRRTTTTTLPARLILSIFEKHTTEHGRTDARTDRRTDGVTSSLLELLVAAKKNYLHSAETLLFVSEILKL